MLHLIIGHLDLGSILLMMLLMDSCGQGQGRSMEGQYASVASPARILGFLIDIVAFPSCLGSEVHAIEDGPTEKKQAISIPIIYSYF